MPDPSKVDPSLGSAYLAAIVGLAANGGLSLGLTGGLLVSAACYMGLERRSKSSETKTQQRLHDAIIIGSIHAVFWGVQEFGIVGISLALVYLPLRLLVARK